ncbi:MAG: glycosyltransferase [Candidatus Omnitrophica bacterium]|nr:glycosyltransferase [Candidatus Omnitrophota bacterium]
MKRCLIVFAKEPERGQVKTRLRPQLSLAQCAHLYKAFLRDTIEIAKATQSDEKILAYQAKSKPAYLKKITQGFRFYKQQGKDLGERMDQALKFARKNGASRAVIVGTDAPTLPARFIEEAFSKLEKTDLVLGPSDDGGYYLIGTKRPLPGLFKGVKWSSRRALRDTVSNARALRKKVALLDEWYDVDEQKDFLLLKRKLKRTKNRAVAKWTRRYLKI